jgi:transketolase
MGNSLSIMLALPDAFLDAGALPTLHDRYGISAEKMVASLQAWLA